MDTLVDPELAVDGRVYRVSAILEALTPHLSEGRVQRMREVLSHRLGSLALGLEDLHHQHNGAACLRTAEGLGVQDVVAAELRNEFPVITDAAASEPEGSELDPVLRLVTAHAHHWLDMHRVDSSAALIQWARSRGMAIYGAGPRGQVTLETLPVERPLLLVFGNEKLGLRDETLAACDATFRIPMYGFTESYNLSVSVGMVLATLIPRIRARLAAEGRTGDLDPERQQQLLAQWVMASVRRPEAILRRKLPHV